MPASDTDLTPLSGASLRELRVQLLQQAAVTGARARAARARGDLHTARTLERRAAALREVARSVQIS